MKDCSNSNENCQQQAGVIYKITNLLNGKVYVGQTTQGLAARFKQHAQCQKTAIGCAILKYGIENFKIEPIEECSREMLNEREIFWIKELNSKAPNGYNLTDGGGGLLNLSEESRARLSVANSGENNPFYGRKHTTETKTQISETNKAKGIKPPSRKGCKLSEEHKEKISIAGTGRECSVETKAKISVANKGRKLSDEHKKKLSLAHKDKKLSAEHRAKISASLKKYNAEKKKADVEISLFEDDNN